jgi:hypothetical protein
MGTSGQSATRLPSIYNIATLQAFTTFVMQMQNLAASSLFTKHAPLLAVYPG